MKRVVVCVLAILPHMACGEGVTDPWPEVAIVTVGTEFALVEETVAISYAISNLSTETTYYIPGRGCGSPEIQVDRRLGGRWVGYDIPPAGPCLAVLGPGSVTLAPFETFEGWISLNSAGVFRLRFPVRVQGNPDSERQQASNSFLVH